MNYKAYIANQEKDNKGIDHGFILQYCDGVDQDYIEKYKDININNIIVNYPIREEYLELLIKNSLISSYIISYQKLSIDLYKKYKDKVEVSNFLKCQKLSENDIKEILDDIIENGDLDYLFTYQILSESFLRFIKEHWIHNDNLKKYIVNFNKLSDEFRKEFELDKHLSESNWLYKSTEFKKQELVETNLYECFDDYFIAYKAIRKDRYSIYNFQYQYLKDCIYESKANYDIDDNASFGLSVGIKEHCKDYGEKHVGNYIIVKCKVYYNDIAAIVYDGDKIRCSKIEMLD